MSSCLRMPAAPVTPRSLATWLSLVMLISLSLARFSSSSVVRGVVVVGITPRLQEESEQIGDGVIHQITRSTNHPIDRRESLGGLDGLLMRHFLFDCRLAGQLHGRRDRYGQLVEGPFQRDLQHLVHIFDEVELHNGTNIFRYVGQVLLV